jgi:hypothetical protein
LIIPGGVGVRDERLTDAVVKFIQTRYNNGGVHVITVRALDLYPIGISLADLTPFRYARVAGLLPVPAFWMGKELLRIKPLGRVP